MSSSATPSSPSGRGSAPPPEGYGSRNLWAVILLLLTPPIVLPLWVGLYDRTDPTLWGFPFYFWFQFALIPLAAALTFTAFLLSKAAERRDREVVARRDRDARGER